jgi:hypothetical protein
VLDSNEIRESAFVRVGRTSALVTATPSCLAGTRRAGAGAAHCLAGDTNDHVGDHGGNKTGHEDTAGIHGANSTQPLSGEFVRPSSTVGLTLSYTLRQDTQLCTDTRVTTFYEEWVECQLSADCTD